MAILKLIFLFKEVILRFHVNFLGCIYTGYNPLYLLRYHEWTSQENKKNICKPFSRLRLPITDKADVWGQGVALLELYSGRPLGRSRDRGQRNFPLPVVQVSRGWQNPWQFPYVIKKWGHFLEIFPKLVDAFLSFFCGCQNNFRPNNCCVSN